MNARMDAVITKLSLLLRDTIKKIEKCQRLTTY